MATAANRALCRWRTLNWHRTKSAAKRWRHCTNLTAEKQNGWRFLKHEIPVKLGYGTSARNEKLVESISLEIAGISGGNFPFLSLINVNRDGMLKRNNVKFMCLITTSIRDASSWPLNEMATSLGVQYSSKYVIKVAPRNMALKPFVFKLLTALI